MDAQLHLLPELQPAVSDWHLDESTRTVGRQGIAAARAALRSAVGSRHDEHDEHSDNHGGGHASAA